ncbi:aminodeoxychorismate synthase component I [Arthrobacter sp. NPDC057259]|uniref:aminodeoxychorismate synthase component I n=1 Tax=Arthrobacter sp. NPDC057259 TaxID=3346073 RepID=UPI00363E44F9
MSPAPVIIAIDGRSGAGKTTLAIELAARLREHRTVSLFHLEDIYPGWNGLAAGIDRYAATVLAPLRRGATAHWTSWDWERHYDGDARTTRPADVVLVEGVGAAAAAAAPYLDAVIWTDAPDGARKDRALERDGDTYAPYWEQWAEQEEAWLAGDDVPTRADVRVLNHADGDAPGQVLQALLHLPALATLLHPERQACHAVPLHAERIDAVPDPARLFDALYGGSGRAVWLDSSLTSDPAGRGRFSILADDGGSHGQSVLHRSGRTSIRAGGAAATIEGGFFRWLDAAWEARPLRSPDGYGCGFALGWLGYLGYELKRETGGSDVRADTPDAALIFAGRAVILDHAEGAVWLLALADPDAAGWLDMARAAVGAASIANSTTVLESADNGGDAAAPVFAARDTAAGYRAKIAAAGHQIAEGNSYEVCLTTALTAAVPAGGVDPWETYQALRRRNPAPFASFLRLDNVAVASTSPERFLRITADGAMRAEPIKGTRRRSADPAADRALRDELAAAPKDRAENIMIVDLLRNDLSHFAVTGSVSVSRLCAVESYATVHQMVSTIDARLRPGASRAEAVAACFPAGSMTGAPKVSTMAILDHLESAPRGVYSGAVGYFSLDGGTDLAVAIRTLVMHDDGAAGTTLSLGVGGAITADSDPAEEYEEIRTKAFGVLSALGSVFPPG